MMRQFIEIAKAIAEESRVRILCLLREQPLCVCQIVEVLNLAPSTISKHLSILYQAGLLDSSKKGRWVYYQVACEDVSPQLCSALCWVFSALETDKQIKQDAERLKTVLNIDPEELCRIQAER